MGWYVRRRAIAIVAAIGASFVTSGAMAQTTCKLRKNAAGELLIVTPPSPDETEPYTCDVEPHGAGALASESISADQLRGAYERSASQFIASAAADIGAGSRGSTQGGIADGAAMVLQDLGRFVANRATTNAFRLLRARVLTWLRCGAYESDGTWKPTPEGEMYFDATCGVVSGLEIGTLATAPHLLRDAFLADLTEIAIARLARALPAPANERILELVRFVVRDIVLPALQRGDDASRGGLDARAIVSSVLRYVVELGTSATTVAENRPAMLAALALSECIEAVRAAAGGPPGSASASISTCDAIGALDVAVDRLSTPATRDAWVDARDRARSIVVSLQSVLATLSSPPVLGSSGPSPVRRAVDAVFAVACTTLGGDNVCEPLPSTPSPQALRVAKTARAVAIAVAERDPAAAAIAVSEVLPDVFASIELAPDAERRDVGRALRLVSALATYGEAIARDREDDTEEAQSARQDLIEAIADEFTDRTARRGDTIISFGGSLRLAMGMRLGHAGEERQTALLSPVGLTLGFSVYHLNRRPGRPGFFAEAAVVDIGQYVSFESEVQVRKPDVIDAIAPTLTLGLAWGDSMPVLIGGFFGYSPSYQFNEDDRNGAIHFGLTVGMNVPIFDLN